MFSSKQSWNLNDERGIEGPPRKKTYFPKNRYSTMVEEASDNTRPQTILIQGAPTEVSQRDQAVDDDGIPPPVKAVTSPLVSTTSSENRGHLLIGAGLMSIFLTPLSFLFLDLIPETDRELVGLIATFMFVLGLFCIGLGASKGQPKKSRPKTVFITNQPIDERKTEFSSAPSKARSANPWIDDGDEPHSFWASMLEEQTESMAAPAKQTKQEIPVSSDAHLFSVMYMICFIPVALLLVIIGGADACVGVLVCCMPELFLLGLFDNSTTKSSPQEVHHQGLNALLVVGLIALFLLMVIAFA